MRFDFYFGERHRCKFNNLWGNFRFCNVISLRFQLMNSAERVPTSVQIFVYDTYQKSHTRDGGVQNLVPLWTMKILIDSESMNLLIALRVNSSADVVFSKFSHYPLVIHVTQKFVSIKVKWIRESCTCLSCLFSNSMDLN